ncbi:16912_t:CDS:1, partial [Cetraspora pellucida]
DDIIYQASIEADCNPSYSFTTADIHNFALHRLESILIRNDMRLEDFPNMPIPTLLPDAPITSNYLIAQELHYDAELLKNRVEETYLFLTSEQ